MVYTLFMSIRRMFYNRTIKYMWGTHIPVTLNFCIFLKSLKKLFSKNNLYLPSVTLSIATSQFFLWKAMPYLNIRS